MIDQRREQLCNARNLWTRRELNMILRTFLNASVVSLLAVGIAYAGQEKSSAPANEPTTPQAIQQSNADSVAALSKQIAGKEDQPAEAVFKNLEVLNKV